MNVAIAEAVRRIQAERELRTLGVELRADGSIYIRKRKTTVRFGVENDVEWMEAEDATGVYRKTEMEEWAKVG
jgi:hypothetical protein